MRNKRAKWSILFLADVFLLAGSIFIWGNFMLTATVLVWLNIMLYSAEDLDERGALLGFAASFFVFLLGRQILERFGLHAIENVFSEELNIHAERLVLISLSCLFLGYIIVKNKPEKQKKRVFDYNSAYYLTVRRISLYFFYATYLFLIITILDTVFFVSNNSYLEFYVSYRSHIPYVLQKIGDMCPVCFFIYLMTMPSKKECRVPIFLYFCYLVLSLGTGKRYPCVAGMLILFVYFTIRNKVNNGGKKWIGKKEILLCTIAIPILIIVLFTINEIRFEKEATTGILSKIEGFFYQQGVSINVIKREVVYRDKFPEGKIYMLGSTIEFLRDNIISRLIGIPHYSGNTVEHALLGNSFAHTLSYVAMGNYYLQGNGLGSCYIAEAFHDFSYAGVIFINILYGIIFKKMFFFKNKGIWTGTISLLLLNSLFLAPRGSADGFVADMVDITTWGTIFVVWLISKHFYAKKKSLDRGM